METEKVASRCDRDRDIESECTKMHQRVGQILSLQLIKILHWKVWPAKYTFVQDFTLHFLQINFLETVCVHFRIIHLMRIYLILTVKYPQLRRLFYKFKKQIFRSEKITKCYFQNLQLLFLSLQYFEVFLVLWSRIKNKQKSWMKICRLATGFQTGETNPPN